MDPPFEARLQEIVSLYAQTKDFVLQAEQLDPKSKSNIAIFKEHRDALDHLMRCFAAFQDPQGPDPTYIDIHFHKAYGHLYRAAYDSLDGISVSLTRQFEEAMDPIPPGAIADLYPEYFSRTLPQLDQIQRQIAEHRKRKDVTGTIENLQAYAQTLTQMRDLINACLVLIPSFRRHYRDDWLKEILKFLLAAAIGAVVVFYFSR